MDIGDFTDGDIHPVVLPDVSKRLADHVDKRFLLPLKGYRIKYAQILLKLVEIPENQEWTYVKVKETHHATPHTICQIAKRFVTEGIEAAQRRKGQVNRRKKIAGRAQAHITAIACSETPEGRERWTLQLIADELVRPGVMENISDTAVMNTWTLNKNFLLAYFP